MATNIVLLSGSPRKGGNTDRLAAALTDGAESAGKSVTTFRVAGMKIAGCLNCDYCFKEKGVCIQKDDMHEILDTLRKSDALVLASPVYFFGISAQLKLAIDRTYAFISKKPPTKRTALLITCGDSSTNAAKSAVVMYNEILTYLKWEDAGVIIATGLYKPDDIVGRIELEHARKLGQEI